jgi:hypothetical protein
MLANMTTDCDIRHYDADHHSAIFWDLKNRGREYSTDFVTVVEFADTIDTLLAEIHRSVLPKKRGFFSSSPTPEPEKGLRVIMTRLTEILAPGTVQQTVVTHTVESRSITICHFNSDIESTVAMNHAFTAILADYGLTTVFHDRIFTARPHITPLS